MNKINKVFLSITGTALLGAFSSGIYLLLAKFRFKGSEIIQIKNVNSSLITECNLGIISPGESKEQSYIVESLVDKDVSCSIKFTTLKEDKATDYINVNASIDGEEIVNGTFTKLFDKEYAFKNKIKNNESKKLIVKYTLATDIPNEIVGSHLDFTLIVETNAFL